MAFGGEREKKLECTLKKYINVNIATFPIKLWLIWALSFCLDVPCQAAL